MMLSGKNERPKGGRSLREHSCTQCRWWLAVWLLLAACACRAAPDPADTAIASRLTPRNIQFITLTVTDGMTHDTVNAIAQDWQGFIWIGTQEGLNRYDGIELKSFDNVLDNPDSLAHDWIWDLLVDRSGTLWVATDGGGLSRFDRESETFFHYRHDSDDPSSLSNDRVRVLLQDSSGAIWAGTDSGGLNRLDPIDGRFVHYRHDSEDPRSLTNDKVLAIHEDRQGLIWVGTDGGGLLRYDPSSDSFAAYRHDPSRSESLSSDRVRAIYEDDTGHLWVGTLANGVSRLDPDHGSFRHFIHDPSDTYSLGKGVVRDIYQDREGTLWVGTESGLCQWVAGTERFVCYSNDDIDSSDLPDNRITRIVQDRGGVLWVGTYKGVARWNYVSDAFRYYGKTAGSESGLTNNIATSIDVSEDGAIWIGTYGGGLNRLDLALGTVRSYRHDPADPGSLSSDKIMAVFAGAEGTVWVGTRDAGLNRLDPATDRSIRYIHDPDNPGSISRNGVTRIYGDSDGSLWVGTYGGGLNWLDPESGRFTVYRHDPNDPSSLSSDRVLSILRDRDSTLWVGTEDGGLNRLDTVAGSFSHFRHEAGRHDSLGSDTAWELLEDRAGALWIGTMGGGLSRWMRADRRRGQGIFRNFSKGDGLLSNTVLGLLEDGDGILWLGTNQGLSRLNPRTGVVRHLDDRDGLKNKEHMQGARASLRDGRLIFGSTEGAVVFDPSRIGTNWHQPEVTITASAPRGMLARSSSTDINPAEVQLSYKDYSISFELAALDFASPGKNRFKYMLVGFDADWVESGLYRRATYTNLPPGTYRFKAKAANNDGVWSERSAMLDLAVDPPPWKSAWAYGLYTLLCVGAVSRYLSMQRKRLKWEAEQRHVLEEKVEERTQEIKVRNNELELLNRKLKLASVTDTLTGLRNRRYLYDFIDQEIAEVDRKLVDAERTGGEIPSISSGLFFMMIDLDGFKLINDAYGHDAGDQALLQVRDVLQRCCRASDIIIRWGGDEFLIVGQPGSRHAVETLAERICRELANHQYRFGSGNVGRLSGSIGLAVYPFISVKPDLANWEVTVAIADQASYIAKENQRNAWVAIYSSGNECTTDALLRIRHDLKSLLDRGVIEIQTSIEGELETLSEEPEQVRVQAT